jgi:heme/copper-type cytochrome/quinol oxidase subunit 2
MNPQAIVTLLILMSVGLIITTAIFGIAVYKTVKLNRNTESMNIRANESKETLAEIIAALN